MALTQKQLLKVFQALSDITRIRVMTILAGSPDPMSVSQLADLLDIKPVLMSHHARILYGAGLLDRHLTGRYTLYTIDRTLLEMIITFLSGYLTPFIGDQTDGDISGSETQSSEDTSLRSTGERQDDPGDEPG